MLPRVLGHSQWLPVPTVAVRAMHTTRPLGAPIGSEMSDNDPAVIDREKKRQQRDLNEVLTGKRTAGESSVSASWCEELASDSEAAIKAERCESESSIVRHANGRVSFMSQETCTLDLDNGEKALLQAASVKRVQAKDEKRARHEEREGTDREHERRRRR
jgi:hypothetical protein